MELSAQVRGLNKRLETWTLERASLGLLAGGATVAAIVGGVALFLVAPDGYWTWALHATEQLQVPGEGSMLLLLDICFIFAYVGAAYVVRTTVWVRAKRIEQRDPARFRPVANRLRRGVAAGIAFVTAAAASDLVENAVSFPMISWGWDGEPWVSMLQAAAWVKWLAFAAGATCLLLVTAASVVRAHDLHVNRPLSSLPSGAKDDVYWRSGRAFTVDEEVGGAWSPSNKHGGVCLSGGGIRSASFSLGALQAITASNLSGIRFVTSVSGGGYMAAAWASLTRSNAENRADAAKKVGSEPMDDGGWRPFLTRSPEERWVRHHTDYLVASLGTIAGALVTLLGGMVFNLLIVFACVQAVAHPVGWVVRAAHPELQANEPIVRLDSQPQMKVGSVVAVNALATREESCAGCIPERSYARVYRVDLEMIDGGAIEAWTVSVANSVEDPVDRREQLSLVMSGGLVGESNEGLVVLRQPTVLVQKPSDCAVATTTNEEAACRVHVSVQPKITVQPIPESSTASAPGARLGHSEVRQLTSLDRQPALKQETGTLGRPDAEYPLWMALGVGLLAVGTTVAFATDGGRRHGIPGRHNASQAMAGLLAVVVILLYGLPYLMQRLPAWMESLPGYVPERVGWPALGAGLLALLPLLRKVGGDLSRRFNALRGFRGRSYLIDGALGLVVCLIGTGIALSVVNVAVVNGLWGRLPGFVDRPLGDVADVTRWAIWTVVLVVALMWPLASHAWSLYSVYRSGLNSSYFLTIEGERAAVGTSYRIAQMDHAAARNWVWSQAKEGIGRLSADSAERVTEPAAADQSGGTENGVAASQEPTRVEPGFDKPDIGPIEEWIVCATANIRGSGEAAPGRAAGSFTFSREWIGGPEVGWMRTSEYVERLADSRKRDVSVPSSVVMSGAAFSPAMGKHSKGWQGRLFALGNLRLGVWVPNPMVVALQGSDARFGGIRSPNVAWYLRELVGWFDRTAPYVYVTDGGHWENLGLVELLRRGCTDVWMVSAAGDGPDSFETTAQAFALAREELGVEFDVDLEPLRPSASPSDDDRQLLRGGHPAPVAEAGFVRGSFFYSTGEVGTIHIVEATLLKDLPWDVHAYGEANSDFPDISTGYQLMDHRDFEAYRMLGYTQMARALADAEQ